MADSEYEAKIRDHPGREFLLEDYRMWLRELEKQDRWFAQSVWVVLTACAVALFVIQAQRGNETGITTALVALAGSLFISMNTDFLANRILTFRQVARRVAAVRKAVGVAGLLRLTATVSYPGSPMLSADPDSFPRTAYLGKGVGFRHLFWMNRVALAALYFGAIMIFRRQTSITMTRTDAGIWTSVCVALAFLHWVAFGRVFRRRISEAATLGEFIVTAARDRGVKVANDAEYRLQRWVRSGADDRILGSGASAIRVILAYEDKRFWRHLGIDPLAVLSVLARRHPGGATTIAMQLARQLMPAPHRGSWRLRVKRKIFEAKLGTYLVLRYGRRFVLSSWLKTIPFGRAGVAGLENAARAYFNKRVEDLDELDGLLLAERITVSSGRYYPNRVVRLARWAANRNLLGACDQNEAGRRLHEMQERVPT